MILSRTAFNSLLAEALSEPLEGCDYRLSEGVPVTMVSQMKGVSGIS
ncbi:MAG: hypothetical protein JRN52_02105 [Nitrososphaerota archaeon]|nr:hypothetical protein [Nitrososphaerota archaeon]